MFSGFGLTVSYCSAVSSRVGGIVLLFPIDISSSRHVCSHGARNWPMLISPSWRAASTESESRRIAYILFDDAGFPSRSLARDLRAAQERRGYYWSKRPVKK